MRRLVSGILVGSAIALATHALWIPVKALAAQGLLRLAWASARERQEEVKPWPWADMHPEMRLRIARVDLDSIVLSDASGRTLAFGPGKVNGTVAPGARGVCVISAHRDTHFAPLQRIVRGDRIVIEDASSRLFEYRVSALKITDETPSLSLDPLDETLILSTCYPFDAVKAGGPLRFLVIAKRVT